MNLLKKWRNNKDIEPSLTSTNNQKSVLSNIQLNDYPDLKKQMKLINSTSDDLVIIKTYQPFVKDGINEIVTVFYDNVLAVPSLKMIIEERT